MQTHSEQAWCINYHVEVFLFLVCCLFVLNFCFVETDSYSVAQVGL